MPAGSFNPSMDKPRVLPWNSEELMALSRLGKEFTLSRTDISNLGSAISGSVLTTGDDGYGSARRLWNGAFDRRPALIVRCATTGDVIQAVNFAREHDLLTAIRGGGHSLSGQSVCDGGLVIDLTMMQGILVDSSSGTAKVQGGVTLGQLDRETQQFGLITPMGTAPDTGVAGLSLGGGIGRLARKFGLACDNIRAVDIVTAQGQLLHASNHENSELFWAVRGGGGNFGVVTSLEYELHPFGPNVLQGFIVYTFKRSCSILRSLLKFAEDAPDDLYLTPLVLPKGEGLGFETCYCGPASAGEKLLAPLRRLGKVIIDTVAVKPYLEVQRQELRLPQGSAYCYKSGFLRPKITSDMIQTMVRSISEAPDSLRSFALLHLGGAVSRRSPQDTAFWNRGANFDLLVWAGWSSRAENVKNVDNLRRYWRTLEPLTSGYYVNTDTSDDLQRLRVTYGENYERLVRVKKHIDPTNLFRLNANIEPTSGNTTT